MQLIPILFKSSIIITAFLLVYYLFLYRSSHFNINRAFLIIGMLLILSIPFIDITYPVYVEMQTYDSKEQFVTIPEEIPDVPVMKEVEPIQQSIDWKITILWIYVVVSILLTLRLLSSLMYGFWLFRTAQKIKWKSSSIYIHHRVKNPMVFGSWIFIRDKSYLEPEKEQVLIHELIHKKQNHWIDMLLSELLLIICWINPLTLVYRKAVQNNLEYIADRGVLNTGLQLNAYIQSILCETMGAKAIVLANHFRTSQNKQRVKMMKNVKPAKWGKFKLLLILPLTGMLLWAFSEPEYLYKQQESITQQELLLQKKDSVKIVFSWPKDTLEVRQQDGTYKTQIIVRGMLSSPDHALVVIKNKESINFPLSNSYGVVPVNIGDTLVCFYPGRYPKEIIYNGQDKINAVLSWKKRYKINGNVYTYDTIVVRDKQTGLLNSNVISKPLPGVLVRAKGYPKRSKSANDGSFELKSYDGATLVFYHPNYKTKEIKYNLGDNLQVHITDRNIPSHNKSNIASGIVYHKLTTNNLLKDRSDNLHFSTEPLSNVTILNQSNGKSTSSRYYGEFMLPSNIGDTLVFKCISFKTIKVVYNGQASLSPVLERDDYFYYHGDDDYREKYFGKTDVNYTKKDIKPSNLNPSSSYIKQPRYKYGREAFFAEIYSKSAKIANEQSLTGHIFVKLLIDKNGNIKKVTPLDNTNLKLFNAAKEIIQELNQWHPAHVRGKYIPCTLCVKVEF